VIAMSYCLSMCSFVCSSVANAYLSGTGGYELADRCWPLRLVPDMLMAAGAYRVGD